MQNSPEVRLEREFWPEVPEQPGTIWDLTKALHRYRPDKLAGAKVARNEHAVRSAKPLLKSAEDREPAGMFIKALAAQLEQLHKSIEQFEKKIAELVQKHPTAKLFKEVPGAGPQLTPRLVAVFGPHKNRFPSAEDLTTYTGIAPIKQSSGTVNLTCARWFRPIFIHHLD